LILHASEYEQKPVDVTKGINKFRSPQDDVATSAAKLSAASKAEQLPAANCDPARAALLPKRTARVSIDLSYGTTASTATAAQQIMPANQANERTSGILSQ
jgi:hypothetical protein